ncbi:hypothetical protein CRM94_26230 [Burkholderia gladioli]|uniref:Uncharacterized protein n=1 Tax=Burkholderia gladioli TaxID=28095 RepID=A0A2A7S3R8_BURGA|nr:hypothetical protein A8H28_28190 [Burkholderia gladioli pv. gladioli]PEH37945.1 hypothetical protein CRM94_26230 [Burkholderia gladioli]
MERIQHLRLPEKDAIAFGFRLQHAQLARICIERVRCIYQRRIALDYRLYFEGMCREVGITFDRFVKGHLIEPRGNLVPFVAE